MKSILVSMISVAGALATIAPTAITSFSAQPQEHRHEHAQPEEAQPLSQRCAAMSEMHQKMMDRMGQADMRLSDLADRMNEASGEAKVEAMAALLNEIVAQRKSMHAHMSTMHERMMGHMMEHMAASMPDDERRAMHEAMKDCPMMKAMHGDPGDEKPEGEGGHEGHEHGGG